MLSMQPWLSSLKVADKDGDGSVNLADFNSLIKGCEGCKLSGEKIEQVYTLFDSSGLNKDTLWLASRTYYSVASETVLTNTDSIEGETVRRLELKELLEVLEGSGSKLNIKRETARKKKISVKRQEGKQQEKVRDGKKLRNEMNKKLKQVKQEVK